MKISSRESILAWVTGAVIILCLSYWFGAPKVTAWREIKKSQVTVRERTAVARKILDQRPEWDKRMEEVRRKLTSQPSDKDASTEFLKLVEQMAKDANVTLGHRRPEKEQKNGELYEMAINCTWEAELEALIRFLYAVEHQSVTMDVDELTVTLVPAAKGRLKGTFTIICAYSRGPAAAVATATTAGNDRKTGEQQPATPK